MSISRTFFALAQGAHNSFSWGAEKEVLEGDLKGNLLNKNFGMAAQIATQGLMKLVMEKRPDIFNFQKRLNKFLNPELDILSISGEATVVKQDEQVKKYLTGKSEDLATLYAEIETRHAAVDPYIGKYFPKTEVSIEAPELFKNDNFEMIGVEYVTLTQDYIGIEHVDPHSNPELLKSNPEIEEALNELADDLVQMFEETGYLMDFVLSGNLAWGRAPSENKSRLFIIDTIPTHITDDHIVGLPAPLWKVERYLENFVDFVAIVKPEEKFPVDMSDIINEWADSADR